jgi:hypothetical protein
VSSYQVGNIAILDTMTGFSGSDFLESSCSSSCFCLALGSCCRLIHTLGDVEEIFNPLGVSLGASES